MAAAEKTGIPRTRIAVFDPPNNNNLPRDAKKKVSFPTVGELIHAGLASPPAFEERRLATGEAARRPAFLCFSSGTTGRPKVWSVQRGIKELVLNFFGYWVGGGHLALFSYDECDSVRGVQLQPCGSSRKTAAPTWRCLARRPAILPYLRNGRPPPRHYILRRKQSVPFPRKEGTVFTFILFLARSGRSFQVRLQWLPLLNPQILRHAPLYRPSNGNAHLQTPRFLSREI